VEICTEVQVIFLVSFLFSNFLTFLHRSSRFLFLVFRLPRLFPHRQHSLRLRNRSRNLQLAGQTYSVRLRQHRPGLCIHAVWCVFASCHGWKPEIMHDQVLSVFVSASDPCILRHCSVRNVVSGGVGASRWNGQETDFKLQVWSSMTVNVNC
jgi:hypothetical protein